MKKYEFTGETMEFEGRTLRQIRYIRNGNRFEKGQLGGWIETEDNLSHEGYCCVMQEAKVFGHARVLEYARIREEAVVKDNAQIKGIADIFGDAIVGADTIVEGKSIIRGYSVVFFYADENYGQPNIYGENLIFNCNIEATGSIHNCTITNSKSLSGPLKMESVIQLSR